MVCDQLKLEVPKWELLRRIKVSVSKTPSTENPETPTTTMLVQGVDQFGRNYMFAPEITV